MRVRSPLFWSGLVTCALLLGACAPPAAPPPTAVPPKAAEAPKPTAAPPKATEAPKPTAAPVKAAEPAKPQAASAATTAPAAKPAAKADWQPEWNRMVAAAKQEGKVVVLGPPGDTFRKTLGRFERAFPDIKVEYTGISTANVANRILTERRAGQYLWDAVIAGSSAAFTLRGERVLDPVRPAFVLPDILDDSKWFGGVDGAFKDSELNFIMGIQAQISRELYVNRDFIPESELKNVEDLADPKWKGKIITQDPRIDGGGASALAHWRARIGDDFVRKVLQQDLTVTTEERQLVEQVVRGRYPIGIALSFAVVENFKNEGAGKNVVWVRERVPGGRVQAGQATAMLVNRPPHPNAAKVFINWMQSRDGGLAFAEETKQNSARTDVPPPNPELAMQPGITYFSLETEASLPLRQQIVELAKQYVK